MPDSSSIVCGAHHFLINVSSIVPVSLGQIDPIFGHMISINVQKYKKRFHDQIIFYLTFLHHPVVSPWLMEIIVGNVSKSNENSSLFTSLRFAILSIVNRSVPGHVMRSDPPERQPFSILTTFLAEFPDLPVRRVVCPSDPLES
jgi:hypothetical protein